MFGDLQLRDWLAVTVGLFEVPLELCSGVVEVARNAALRRRMREHIVPGSDRLAGVRDVHDAFLRR